MVSVDYNSTENFNIIDRITSRSSIDYYILTGLAALGISFPSGFIQFDPTPNVVIASSPLVEG